MTNQNNSSDIIIIGAGIAGLVCALESLKRGKRVLMIDAQSRARCGGLACVAFGGMALIGTPEQKSKNIIDNPEIALKDWLSFAQLSETDYWPRKWAEYYVENSIPEIYDYVKSLDIKFLPAVGWVERGLDIPGNSVPRYHILWGASLRLVNQILQQLKQYEGKQLIYLFDTKVTGLIQTNGHVVGTRTNNADSQQLEHYASNIVIASGGFTGNLDMVRQHWPVDWKSPVQGMLNGTHPSNDGALHNMVDAIGGVNTHLDCMWNYAAGIPNPKPDFAQQGLSLIPSKSALWIDHLGHKIGPPSLVSGYDTLQMCHQINELQIPHSWQILNRRIALKELAISGCEHNEAIRDRKFMTMVKDLVFGNKKLLSKMLKESDHFIIADNLNELVAKMNALTPEYTVSLNTLQQELEHYDAMIESGEQNWKNDDQLRRIMELRQCTTDKMRTCYPKPIQNQGPLIAIKLNLITRKCLGGIQTDLNCRVLSTSGKPISGLMAIGEAAGFGGGGTSGKRSLEGTFLSGCILSARQAARHV